MCTYGIVKVHLLKNDVYITKTYSETDTILVHVLEDHQINLSDVFEDI